MTSPLPGVRWLRANAAKILVVSMLALPLVATLLPGPSANHEQRPLAPAPAAPTSWPALLAWPAAADAWASDHFGGRSQMVVAYARLRHDVFGRFPTNQAMLGRDGRVFLSAHNKAGEGEPYNAIKLACGWQHDNPLGLVLQVNAFARLFRARGIDARLLIVPSAPVVYSEQLLPWQAERCAPEGAPANLMLNSPRLDPEARAHTYFPLAEMRAMRQGVRVFPLTFFHWGGAGAAAVAALTEQYFWRRGDDFGQPIPLVARRKPSDIHWLFPGIEHDSIDDEPDFTGTTITACYGPDCFPELKPIMEKLAVVGRYTNRAPHLAGRLVVVSDSFGFAGAPAFARYHREVVFVSTNALSRLSRDEVAALRNLLLRPGSGDQVLFLYHDATVYSDRIATDLGMLRP